MGTGWAVSPIVGPGAAQGPSLVGKVACGHSSHCWGLCMLSCQASLSKQGQVPTGLWVWLSKTPMWAPGHPGSDPLPLCIP